MRIEVKGRNVPVSDDLKQHITRRFRVIDRQVSRLAQLRLEVFEQRGAPAAQSQVAEATLQLKGVTLRARSAAHDMRHAIVMVSEQLDVQVKRHRDKRRRRREARVADLGAAGLTAEASTQRSDVTLVGRR